MIQDTDHSSSSADHVTLTLPFGNWSDEGHFAFDFPAGWRVFMARPKDAPEITAEQIAEAFARPVGIGSIGELAQGKRSAVVVVDDITRPTPAYRVLPRLLGILQKAGLGSSAITILVGGGAHRSMADDELNRKIGPEIARRYQVVQHDFLGEDVRRVGRIAGGPVYLNRHFLDAELRITLGNVAPHHGAGFSGGAKLIVPGIAGQRTIAHFHGALEKRPRGQAEQPVQDEPVKKTVPDARAWAEAVAEKVGVHAAVCTVVNSQAQLAGVVVGDVAQAHHYAARFAEKLGRTVVRRQVADDAQLIVANTFPLDTDPVQTGKALDALTPLDADTPRLILDAATDGIHYHGLGMGCGIDRLRLLRNLPGFLLNPGNLPALLAAALLRRESARRRCYYLANHLSYRRFSKRKPRQPVDPPVVADIHEADPLIFSPHFPYARLGRKFPHARLYRRWGDLRMLLERQMPVGSILLLPCAPLQLLELTD